VRLVETEDKYWGTIGAINENFVNVPRAWCAVPHAAGRRHVGHHQLTYDETEVHNKKIRPFKVTEFTPFQISMIDVREFIEKRPVQRPSGWTS
jgi:ATP-dependent Lon protease